MSEYLPCFYGFKYCSGCLNGVICFLAYTNFVYILRDQNNIYILYVICGTINPYLRSIRDRLPCYDVEITRVSVVILKLDGENNVWWSFLTDNNDFSLSNMYILCDNINVTLDQINNESNSNLFLHQYK
jgi:hypothetical protein